MKDEYEREMNQKIQLKVFSLVGNEYDGRHGINLIKRVFDLDHGCSD